MENIIIFGVGEVAEVVHYYLTHESARKVVAFTVDREYVKADSLLGVPVVPFDEIEVEFPPREYQMFVAASFRKVNVIRQQKVAEAEAKGYSLASHLSPRAYAWSGLVLHPNTLIMEHNVIQPYVKIGRNVIIWSGNHIGHHTTIGDHCFIASQAVISGSVTVGEGTFIGVNATLRDNISIGRRNVIGAGALILADTEDEAVYIGPPAKLVPRKSSDLRSI